MQLRTRTRGTAALRALSRPSHCLWRSYSTRGNDTDANPHDERPSPTPQSETPSVQSHGQRSSAAPPPVDVEAIRRRLKDWSVLASSSLRQRVDAFSKSATTTFSHLGLHLNRATGYDEIEALKRKVVEQEARIKDTRRAAREAKSAYDDAVRARSVSQRQVNDLLQRKSSWTDTDVGSFTSLVRADHSWEQTESRAKTRVAETEDAVEREFTALLRVILARYHEEQVWSDKIRSASTYGSLAVLGVNVVVFIVAIVVVEPWKRKRLAQTFERKVEEMGTETKVLVADNAARLEAQLAGHQKVLTELISQVATETRRETFATTTHEVSPETPAEISPFPSWWSQVYFSYPHLGVIRGRELVLVAGSAAAGGVITLLTHSVFSR